MTSISARVRSLERTAPTGPVGCIVIYEREPGKLTRDGAPITRAEVAELEKTHTVILVEYVENWRGSNDRD